MKAWTKVLMILILSFSTVFTCVGYAALTDELSITGTVEVSEPEKVYITDILSVTGSTTEPTYEIASYTVVRSSVTLGPGGADTVSMRIRVKNNTDILYGFNAIRYSSSAYDNENIEVNTDMERRSIDENGNEKDGTVIEPGGTIEFTATFSHKSGAASSNLALNSLINYEFLPFDQISPDIVDTGVANDALEQFENILNNPDTKTSLDNQMQNNGGTWGSGHYIANFDEATPADKELVEALFGDDKLNMVINGQETSVKLIIKEQDVYGDSEKEYTLYLTTHSLKRADAETESGWFGTTYYYASPVYAVVFTVNEDGTWTQIGDMYTGRGRINDYSGGSGEGSVNTDTWESTQAYGSAAAGSSISQVIRANVN